jgi:hypothetical protein
VGAEESLFRALISEAGVIQNIATTKRRTNMPQDKNARSARPAFRIAAYRFRKFSPKLLSAPLTNQRLVMQ